MYKVIAKEYGGSYHGVQAEKKNSFAQKGFYLFSRTQNYTYIYWAGRAIVSLLMVGGIVYLVSASAAGTWIAENVMAPMISAFSGNNDADNDGTQDATNTQTPDGSLSTSVDLSAGASSQSVTSAQVSLPALDCFMLQMGVYSSKSNAEAQAETLQAQGAGGYILEDASTGETRYRVMASGYEDAESAKSVKNRLVDEGIDCTVYELSTAAATFRVTASEESIPQIEAGFAALEKAQRALSTAAIDFDKNSMGVEEGQSLTLEILSTLESDMGGLLSFDGTDGTLSQLLDAYRDAKAALQSLSGGSYDSTVGFSAQLKHTLLYVTHRYALLMDALV